MKVWNIFNVVLFVKLSGFTGAKMAVTTCDRLGEHGYPCENHTVQTSDGYILTMFRIPYSPRLEDHQRNATKAAVFLMHGILCSSDVWVLNGPNDGLPYLLADAGYDVWMGNARGNVYSQQHVSVSPTWWAFWNFSWDEIGRYDLPANIDYILSTTGQLSLHYVGYSQGTTVFMVLLSSKPSYNQKIRSSHFLGPSIFLCYMRLPLGVLTAPILGGSNMLAKLAATFHINLFSEVIRFMSPGICKVPSFLPICYSLLNLFTGVGSPHLNMTLLPDIYQTIPADCSTRQILHFMQSYISCEFKPYDHGNTENIRKYGKPQPPPYNLANVKPVTPIALYFADNDNIGTPEDVKLLADIMGDRVRLHRVIFSKYNHLDFSFAENIKIAINDCIVDKIGRYEGRPYNGSMCNNFRNKPF